MVGEVAGSQPRPPEPRGGVERLLGGLEAVGAVEARRPGEGEETTFAGLEPAAGAGATAFDPDIDVRMKTQRGLAVAGVGNPVLGAGPAPGGGSAAVTEGRLADLFELNGAMHAARRPHEHVMGIEVRGRAGVSGRLGRFAGSPLTEDQGVADDHPARRGHPRRLDDVRPRLVAAADRLAHVGGAETPTAGGAIEQRREDAGRVEPRRAEPLHGPVRGDERAGVAIGEKGVVGDRGERRGRHPALDERSRLRLLVRIHAAGATGAELGLPLLDQLGFSCAALFGIHVLHPRIGPIRN